LLWKKNGIVICPTEDERYKFHRVEDGIPKYCKYEFEHTIGLG
jgi:hypothetical protein